MDELAYYFDPEDFGDDAEAEYDELVYEEPVESWRTV